MFTFFKIFVKNLFLGEIWKDTLKSQTQVKISLISKGALVTIYESDTHSINNISSLP